jgi:acid stress-induced BolA-like protein IbaG/YrbA
MTACLLARESTRLIGAGIGYHGGPLQCRVQASMNAAEVQALIQTGLPGAQVRVASDDDTHFEAVIVAPQFEGRRMIQRHQLVYATLGQLMGREIHALSIQAFAPSEQK